MKIYSIVLISALGSFHAFGEPTRTERLQAQASAVSEVESKLSNTDLEALDYYLGGIDAILSRYQVGQKYVCLSNGQPGSYERFKITDPETGTTLGGETSLANCKEVLSKQNLNLLCLSNGQVGSYEKFAPYDTAKKDDLGGNTELKTCLTLVAKAKPNTMCLSNGQPGSYEKFQLYSRKSDKMLGGATTLENCLSVIVN